MFLQIHQERWCIFGLTIGGRVNEVAKLSAEYR